MGLYPTIPALLLVALLAMTTNAFALKSVFEEHRGPIIGVFIGLIFFVVYFVWYARRYLKGPMPSITLVEVFDDFWRIPDSPDSQVPVIQTQSQEANAHYLQLVRALKRITSDEMAEESRKQLRQLDIEILQSANPLITLRKAIMEHADNMVHEQLLLGLPESDREKIHEEMRRRTSQSSDQLAAALLSFA